MNKIFAFDYMLSLFEQWYKDEGKESMNFQNCSKLSVLKLLFLTAAPKREGARDLLDVFNNFHALPYGPVESDIYNAIQDNRYEILIKNKHTNDEKKYTTDSGKRPIVSAGELIEPGQMLTAGQIHPKELIKVSTAEAVENYILVEVQKVYRSQGVEIADKHIEIIIKQMLRKVVVLNEGGTDLLPGSHISRSELQGIIAKCIEEGTEFPIVKPILLGITRSSLKSDSFLSAASFQETTRVLTEAAIRGKKDTLEGLKENIIIGGLIPAGTGLAFADYKVNADYETNDNDDDEE